jgi:uncharacterized protein (DUF736 family)
MKDQDYTGILHHNTKKSKSTSPDYTGSFVVEEQKYSLSCWHSANHKGSDSGKGLLFPNPEKASETHPDYVGWIISPSMVRYSLSAWKRVSGAGNEYLKLSVREWKESGLIIPSDAWGLACQLWRNPK